MNNQLTEMFGIEYPIFAFSHCRDVVAAVTNAGGMGVLGALAFSPEELEMELTWIDEHVNGKPYGVDVVMPVKTVDRDRGIDDVSDIGAELRKHISQDHWDYVDKILTDHGVDLEASGKELESGAGIGAGVLGWTAATGSPQIDIALSHPIALLASALGPPPKAAIDQAHAQGVKVAALIGRVEQAVRDVQLGVDIIIAQGYEAGGHTGEVSTMVLVPDVVDAIAPVPVLAAGGVGTGRQMAAGMALGAAGVWTGSIWLTVAENGSSTTVTEKLLAATSTDTVRSRAYTGKPARQLRTAWTDAWEAPESPGTLPMPLQFILNSYAANKMGSKPPRELVGMPVGQIVSRMNQVRSSKAVIQEMVEEYVDTTQRLSADLEV
ncbi:nitronate monooxygenase family protein [Aquihabitans sp. G128]|uniref:nitronate monooxygenase n=1 Tax=Aquihabitans sp. G128 TaxID=2849779 RepID=UPI001C240615|nr:nitronate monooxygenase family protein [Aquihabitans sp. G128]QXC61398.1 nitronate monooxygenase family protein [Aquihabitans sp. G128]